MTIVAKKGLAKMIKASRFIRITEGSINDGRDNDTKIALYLIHKQFVYRTINFIINCLLYDKLNS
jgi:hypothetical protein